MQVHRVMLGVCKHSWLAIIIITTWHLVGVQLTFAHRLIKLCCTPTEKEMKIQFVSKALYVLGPLMSPVSSLLCTSCPVCTTTVHDIPPLCPLLQSSLHFPSSFILPVGICFCSSLSLKDSLQFLILLSTNVYWYFSSQPQGHPFGSLS